MRARASLALLLALGLAVGGATSAGCGGGGGGGGGGGNVTPPPTGGFPSLGLTQEIRPDLLFGSTVPAVSLQDQRTHVYRFPASPGPRTASTSTRCPPPVSCAWTWSRR